MTAAYIDHLCSPDRDDLDRPIGVEVDGRPYIAATDGRILVAIEGAAEPGRISAAVARTIADAIADRPTTTVETLRAWADSFRAPGSIGGAIIDRRLLSRALVPALSGPCTLHLAGPMDPVAIRGQGWVVIVMPILHAQPVGPPFSWD